MDKARHSEILEYARSVSSTSKEMPRTSDIIIANLLAMLVELLCDTQININYSPTINSLDSKDTKKFIKELEPALKKMVQANVGGIRSTIKQALK